MKLLVSMLFCFFVITVDAQLPPTFLNAKNYPLKKNSDSTSQLHPAALLQTTSPARGTIVMLHPSLGNTITREEKKKFGLFPKQADSTFESARLVKYNDSTFTILFRDICDEPSETPFSIEQLLAMYIQVENTQPAPGALQQKDASGQFVKGADQFLDIFGTMIHTSAVILTMLGEFQSYYSHHAATPAYDGTKSYLPGQQDHYIPKE